MSSRDYRRNKTDRQNYQFSLLSNIAGNISRRIFCIRFGQISAFASFLSSCSKFESKTLDLAANQDRWETINALYDHLLPEDGFGPSAQQINASNYLKNIFESSKTSRYRKYTITEGVTLVNKVSNQLSLKNFTELSSSQKEATLREVEKKDLGDRFLSLLIDMMLESLLGDPVYGCQPNFVGWQWLEHIPGFPRPEKASPKVV